ncbi:MAG TPA: Stp1/IreP family PP2C-type Ser/Thr phosphatase [bacterium]|nr:Stp1/IreP family PP2C-type Ser/Thr phosphatase [bacterium]
MEISAFGFSDVGKKREKNEDSFLVAGDLCLYAVADGMGGHQGGDFASSIAVSTIEEIVRELENDPEMTLQEEAAVPIRAGEYQGYLRYAIQLASQRIYEKASVEAALKGMGTTAVVLLFRNNKAYIANVGDSRAYRMRRDRIDQITKDHSLVGEQIRAGILSQADARSHRLKNIITRSVGFQEEVDADIDIRVVREGDRFLLCSDGLSNMMEDEEILEVAATNTPEAACRRLVDIANERGGDDNITVVIVEVKKLDPESAGVESEPTMEA